MIRAKFLGKNKILVQIWDKRNKVFNYYGYGNSLALASKKATIAYNKAIKRRWR
jgi:hypothetical protein